jgi:hypothetical protein
MLARRAAMLAQSTDAPPTLLHFPRGLATAATQRNQQGRSDTGMSLRPCYQMPPLPSQVWR